MYTRKPPFAKITNDAQVTAQVLQGARPEKPENCGRFQQGFWNLVKMCWNEDPSDRPDAAFIAAALSPQDNTQGLLMTDYHVIFAPSVLSSSHTQPTQTYDVDDESNPGSPFLGSQSSFEPSSFKPTSVLKSAFGSPFSEVGFSPSSSSFGVVSLPASSIHASPEEPGPIKKKQAKMPFGSSSLRNPSPMSSSPFSVISSSADSMPIAIAASQPRSFDPYEFVV